MKIHWTLSISIAILFLSCFSASKTENQNLSFLALGDSYTIGEAVAPKERWPIQLQEMLIKDGYQVDSPIIIAKTGWRTDDLISAIKKENITKKYDLVSLLIGVNNQYQGRNIQQYEIEMRDLVEMAISKSKKGEKGLMIVSIPDYGVSSFARNRNPEKIGREIDLYNKIARSIARDYGVIYIDITPISRMAKTDTELISNDKLHPSGKMYHLWMKEIFPEAKNIISN